MTGYVYVHPSLAEGALRTLFQTLGGLDYAIQETEVRVQFVHFSKMDDLWNEGRAFGEFLEVRWLLRPQTSEVSETSEVLLPSYRVQVLSENLVETLVTWKQFPPMETAGERKQYLWGRHWSKLEGAKDNVPHAWTEALIPGLETLKYPLEPVEFAFLQTIDYRQNGVTRLTRFKGLAGEPDQKDGAR